MASIFDVGTGNFSDSDLLVKLMNLTCGKGYSPSICAAELKMVGEQVNLFSL